MADSFTVIRQQIIHHPDNLRFLKQGYQPLYTAGAGARIAAIGQAPGLRAQQSGIAWNDASGLRLLGWLGVDSAAFHDPQQFAILPMDFYYPGKGKSGDLPPRPGFAETWHPRLLALMPELRLLILIGSYAQRHYLGKQAKKTLTETVQAYQDYLPDVFPIVHPSPLNFRWQARNPWFEEAVVPVLRDRVQAALQAGPSHPDKIKI